MHEISVISSDCRDVDDLRETAEAGDDLRWNTGGSSERLAVEVRRCLRG
jgi:hypothetical protein